MTDFTHPVTVRWADIDINRHVRHSVYYDWCADTRLAGLQSLGMTAEKMQKMQVGVILLREECVFKREIHLGDQVRISLSLLQARRDYSRWSFRHHIMKNSDTLSAILTVDGAWIDMEKRKLAIPPPEMVAVFEKIPRTEEFRWQD
jgi:acyl-CoA thioester hydrolase